MTKRFRLINASTLAELTEKLNSEEIGLARVVFINVTTQGFEALIDAAVVVVVTTDELMDTMISKSKTDDEAQIDDKLASLNLVFSA